MFHFSLSLSLAIAGHFNTTFHDRCVPIYRWALSYARPGRRIKEKGSLRQRTAISIPARSQRRTLRSRAHKGVPRFKITTTNNNYSVSRNSSAGGLSSATMRSESELRPCEITYYALVRAYLTLVTVRVACRVVTVVLTRYPERDFDIKQTELEIEQPRFKRRARRGVWLCTRSRLQPPAEGQRVWDVHKAAESNSRI